MELMSLADSLKEFDRDVVSFRKDVESVREWMKSQAHLPEVMEDKTIESFLLLNKCSIEKTKKRIDAYYTARSLYSDLRGFDMKNEAFQMLNRYLYQLILPKVLNGKYRVILFKLRDPSLNDLVNIDMFYTSILNMLEIHMREDYCFNYIVICDHGGGTNNWLLKFVIGFLKFVPMIMNAFVFRFHSAYVVNALPIMNKAMAMVKPVLKAKLYDRIHVSESVQIALDVAKDVLPRDFYDCGSDQPTLEEIQMQMMALYKKHEAFLSHRGDKLVNESLRVELVNSDTAGYYGNFKKIDID